MSVSLSSYEQIFFPSSDLPLRQTTRKLPAMTRSCHKSTLVLDLDETLIHSSSIPIENPDDVVFLNSGGQKKPLFVKYRPGLFEFLNRVSLKFELVIFTASTRDYAEQVINKFDCQRRLLKYRFYREDCTDHSGQYVKDLGKLGRDLSKVIILDNSITAFLYQLNNGIPIASWFNDPNDRELEKACFLLEQLEKLEDVRPALNSMFNLPKLLEEFKKSIQDKKINVCSN
jgi:CTD small phosphatase-like protein 2